MPTLASIDVGSNAMRLAIGFVGHDRVLHVVEELREPVRLGQDVFTKGRVGRETLRRSVQAFRHFKEIIDQHGVLATKAVGTSALREASNRDLFLKRILQETGIELKVISAEEEALLVYEAVSQKFNLSGKTAMLIDIGGGSVEITLARKARILAAETFQMGAVRLLQVLESRKYGEKRFNKLVQQYVESAQARFRQKLGNERPDICVGTGGNLDALSDLKGKLLRAKETTFVTLKELDHLIQRLRKLTYEERILKLGLRPDRADVILPASLALQKVMASARVGRIHIPHVGVKEGLLIDMVSELLTGRRPLHRDEVMASVRQTGLKYTFDEPHAETVSRLALELFDRTKRLHRLGDDQKLLLEAAARLHDIGQFVSYAAHHKHSYYLIKSAQLIGLSADQVELVATISRYHRKSIPKLKHEEYRALPPRERLLVSKLAALLRVADAMDHDHSSRVRSFRVSYKRPHFGVKLLGTGDMMLEKWSLRKKCDLFEKVFKVRFSVKS